MKWLGYLMSLVLGIMCLLLGIFNDHNVTFDYLFGSGEWPLVWVMIVSFFFGALLVLAVFGVKATFWHLKAVKLQAQLDREHRDAHHHAVKSRYESESTNF